MKRRTLTSLLLLIVLMLSVLPMNALADAAYTPGSYSASAAGFGGEVTVTVTVDEQAILSVEAAGAQETEGIGTRAIEALPAKIVEAGSASVDSISGATITSAAILEATAKALSEAQGASEAVAMTPGTYRGYGKGMTGTLVVDVTVSETAIEKVEYINQIGKDDSRLDPNFWLYIYQSSMLKETQQFLKTVVDRLPERIAASQTTNVDVVTGATATSNGFILAVKDALTQAGAPVGAFSAPVPKKAVTETYDADVVVIGGGTSGATAAARAHDQGAKVVLIEKSGRVGGTGTVSSTPTTIGAKVQLEAGMKFDHQVMYTAWMNQCHWSVNGKMISDFLMETGPTADFLIEKGFEFDTEALKGDHSNSGFSTWVLQYKENGIGTMGPQGYFNKMCKDVDTILFETAAKSLIVDETGAICGVKALKDDGTEVIVNCKAVIVATGGISFNEELMEEYMGAYYKPLGLTQNTGDGFLMMRELNAKPHHIGGVCAHQTEVPVQVTGFNDYDTSIPYTITNLPVLVRLNSNGQRFMDENGKAVNGATTSTAAIAAQGGQFFTVLDQKQYDLLKAQGSGALGMDKLPDPSYFTMPLNYDEPMTNIDAVTEAAIEIGMAFKGDTLEELAKASGMNYDVLLKNLTDYNESCAAGYDEYLFKNPDYLYPYDLENGPYYAFLGCCTSYGTIGGVLVDEFFRVLDEDDQVIEGLYAVGMDSAGAVMDGVAYPDLRGEALSWCFTSGRLAGENATAYATR